MVKKGETLIIGDPLAYMEVISFTPPDTEYLRKAYEELQLVCRDADEAVQQISQSFCVQMNSTEFATALENAGLPKFTKTKKKDYKQPFYRKFEKKNW